MLRLVIDPGVLIAALISALGAPRQLILSWLDGEFELLVSPMLLAELERVLERHKFRKYVSLRDAKSYAALFRRFASFARTSRLYPRSVRIQATTTSWHSQRRKSHTTWSPETLISPA